MRIGLATFSELPRLNADDRLLLPALARYGLQAEPVLWGDAPPPDMTAIVIRSCWDYCEKLPQFIDWLRLLRRHGVRVLNGTEIVEWNASKEYLRELEAAGTACVETLWVRSPEELESLERLVSARDWHEVVVKPSISNNAGRTHRVAAGRLWTVEARLRDVLRTSPVLVQRYHPEIEQFGEISFMIFGGAFSHAVLKRPFRGDFRVQHTHGGNYAPIAVPPPWIELAERAAAHRPEHLYCRVDMIPTDDGLRLGELEMIEPYLHFSDVPGSADRFAAQLAKRLYLAVNTTPHGRAEQAARA